MTITLWRASRPKPARSLPTPLRRGKACRSGVGKLRAGFGLDARHNVIVMRRVMCEQNQLLAPKRWRCASPDQDVGVLRVLITLWRIRPKPRTEFANTAAAWEGLHRSLLGEASMRHNTEKGAESGGSTGMEFTRRRFRRPAAGRRGGWLSPVNASAIVTACPTPEIFSIGNGLFRSSARSFACFRSSASDPSCTEASRSSLEDITIPDQPAPGSNAPCFVSPRMDPRFEEGTYRLVQWQRGRVSAVSEPG